MSTDSIDDLVDYSEGLPSPSLANSRRIDTSISEGVCASSPTITPLVIPDTFSHELTMVRTRSQERSGRMSVSPDGRASPNRSSRRDTGANATVVDVLLINQDQDVRHTAVFVEAIDKRFPAPSEYDEVDPQHVDAVSTRLLGLAPWFDRDVVYEAPEILAAYADEQGYLPGQIHLDCVHSWLWRRAFCARDADLKVPAERLPSSIKEDFVLSCYEGLNRMTQIDPIPADAGVDMFVCRSRYEEAYLEAVRAVPNNLIDSWRTITGVRQAAILLQRPMLRQEFRYISRRSDFGLQYLPGERWARSKWGQAVPFQCPQVELMSRDSRRRTFCRLTEAFHSYEVPQGCPVPTPPICGYKGSEMMRRDSGWWVVCYTDFVCRTAAFLLADVYDSLRLWWIPRATIEACRSLDLSTILGSQANVTDFLELLNVIEGVDFYQYPESQSLRYLGEGHRRSRWTPCADFVFYDPWERQLLTKVQYESLRTRGRRQMPVGHPTGYDFEDISPSWDGRTFTPTERDDLDVLPVISQRPFIDFLGVEAERTAREGLYILPTAYPPTTDVNNTVDRSSPGNVVMGGTADETPAVQRPEGLGGNAPPSQVVGIPSRTEDEVIRDWLRRVGLPDANTTGNATEMMYYLRGRLGL